MQSPQFESNDLFVRILEKYMEFDLNDQGEIGEHAPLLHLS